MLGVLQQRPRDPAPLPTELSCDARLVPCKRELQLPHGAADGLCELSRVGPGALALTRDHTDGVTPHARDPLGGLPRKHWEAVPQQGSRRFDRDA